MIELVAEGRHPRQRWRQSLDEGAAFVLGRSVQADLPVPWDPQISRSHVRVQTAGGALDVQLLAGAKNPLFFEGREVRSCRVRPGSHFVCGETSFLVREAAVRTSPGTLPIEEITFDPAELRKVTFRDADRRIEVLSHLPEVIWGARTDTELHQRLAHLLLTGVPHAEAVAVVEPGTGNDSPPVLLHWDRRRETAGRFRPSSRLVGDALLKRRRTVLHVWEGHDRSSDTDYTAAAEFDWAFCTPVIVPGGPTWGLYVAGRLDLPPTVRPGVRSQGPGIRSQASEDRGSRIEDRAEDHSPLTTHHSPDQSSIVNHQSEHQRHLHADVKFTEIVAEIMASVQRLKVLERQQAGFRRFFAPPILEALGENPDTSVLEPRECEVTVLFCDLRGFSQQAEEASGDLIGLLDRVSQALEVMTRHILQHGGVTGDFQGDATLGFWGWPFASDQSVLDACRAALKIRAAFREAAGNPGHPLADFRMGIGIAHGRAVAGAIGTSEQVKPTVFGPVVNLASRLEGLTRQLRVPIVLDEATAGIVRERLPRAQGRVRRLARIQPYGMETSLVVSELLPPLSVRPELTDEMLEQYEAGVEHFIAGRWEDAYRCLHKMPEGDRAPDFLQIRIAEHNRVAPPGWTGVIRFTSK